MARALAVGDVEAVEEAAVDLDAVARCTPLPRRRPSPAGGCTVRTIGSWCCVAKSQSRSSSAGTAMIAPVP